MAKAEAAARVSRPLFSLLFKYFLFFQRPSTERRFFFFFILVEMMFEGRSVSSINSFRRLASSSPPSRGSDGGGR